MYALNVTEFRVPQFKCFTLCFANSMMISLFPCLQSGHDSCDALLADFHQSTDSPVLKISAAHKIFTTGQNSRCGSTEEFVTTIDDDIGTLLQESFEVILRRCIDNNRNVSLMTNFRELLQRDHSVLNRVM